MEKVVAKILLVLIALVIPLLTFAVFAGLSTAIVYFLSFLCTEAFDVPRLTLLQSLVVGLILGFLNGGGSVIVNRR